MDCLRKRIGARSLGLAVALALLAGGASGCLYGGDPAGLYQRMKQRERERVELEVRAARLETELDATARPPRRD